MARISDINAWDVYRGRMKWGDEAEANFPTRAQPNRQAAKPKPKLNKRHQTTWPPKNASFPVPTPAPLMAPETDVSWEWGEFDLDGFVTLYALVYRSIDVKTALACTGTLHLPFQLHEPVWRVPGHECVRWMIVRDGGQECAATITWSKDPSTVSFEPNKDSIGCAPFSIDLHKGSGLHALLKGIEASTFATLGGTQALMYRKEKCHLALATFLSCTLSAPRLPESRTTLVTTLEKNNANRLLRFSHRVHSDNHTHMMAECRVQCYSNLVCLAPAPMPPHVVEMLYGSLEHV